VYVVRKATFFFRPDFTENTTVRRNLETAGVKAFFLGHGKHGIARYLARDVKEYERRCPEP
jgi:hypothetical protein